MTGSIIKFEGKDVLKIERDLKALPFDVNNIEATVDEPHYARLVGLEDFENGTIEVKMYSRFKIHRRIQALQDSSAYISELKKTTPPLTEFM